MTLDTSLPGVFREHEIICVHPVVRQSLVKARIPVRFSDGGRGTLHQVSGQSSKRLAAAMLILDHGGEPTMRMLRSRRSRRPSPELQDIKASGLRPLLVPLHGDGSTDFLHRLAIVMARDGSAIVRIVDASDESYSVVVDRVDDRSVRIRDPRVGRELTVCAAAFQRVTRRYYDGSGSGSYVVQIHPA